MKNLAASPISFLLFFFLSNSLFSQNTRLADSLHQRILLEKNDSARAVLYDDLSLVFFNSNIDSAEALVRKGCFFARKSGCTTCQVLCYKGLGFAKNRRYQLDEAILMYDTAQALAEKSKNWCLLSFIYANKAGAFNRKLDYETALKWNRKSVELAESTGCTAKVFGLYFNLYNTLRNMGRNLEAIAPLRKAVEIAEKSGIVANQIIGQITLADELINAKKMEQAKPFAEKALQLSRSVGDKYNEATALLMLGRAAGMEENYETEYIFLKQARDAFGNSKDMFLKANLFSTAALNCAHVGRYDEALEILGIAYPLAQKQNSTPNILTCLRAYGKVHQMQNDPAKSEACFLEAIQIADKTPAQLHMRLLPRLNLREFYEQYGFWEKALKTQHKYQQLVDSLNTNDQQIQLAVLETELHFHKDAADRDRQIALHERDLLFLKNEKLQSDFLFSKQNRELLAGQLEAEKQEANLFSLQTSEREKILENTALNSEIQQKTAENKARTAELTLQSTQIRLQRLLFGLLGIGLLASFWWVFSFFKKRQKQNILTLRANISRDLHDDLGSEISSISLASFAAARSGDPEKMRPVLENIAGQSQKLVEDMRDIVWSLNPANDTFDKLLARVRQFAAQVFENRENVNLKFQVSGDPKTLKLEPEARRHIYLFIKEAINNIAKYADCTTATVAVDIGKQHFSLEIRDNGAGFDPKSVAEGNGLPNLRARAAAVGGDFDVSSEVGNGTLIRLEVPLSR